MLPYLALPPNTTPSISQTNKVYYFYDGVMLSAGESPQTLYASSYNPGAYQLLSIDAANSYTWPIPMGRTLEIQIPVISTSALSGATLQANVWVLDGNASPWLRPQEGVYVFNSVPAIFYPTPSTISIGAATAHSLATVYTGGLAGIGYFDLGTTTSYGMIHESVAIAAGSTSYQVWDDWGPPALARGVLYHWRFTFTTGGTTCYGADQTFTTIGGTASIAGTPSRMNPALPQVRESMHSAARSLRARARTFGSRATGWN